MGKMSEKVEKILQQYNIPQEKYQEIGKELANRYTKLNEITQSFSSTLSQRTEINEEGLNVLSNAISKISKIIDIISKFYLTWGNTTTGVLGPLFLLPLYALLFLLSRPLVVGSGRCAESKHELLSLPRFHRIGESS